MNQCIVDLFQNPALSDRFVLGQPLAFEMAKLELPKGNPAVGFLREYAITSFFITEFGHQNVNLPDSGVKRGFDIYLNGRELSIKTVTGNGKVKVLWTVDSFQIGREIASDYSPSCDILLVNIFWGKEKDSVFFIPESVQKEVFENLGGQKYLVAAIGTNHRGISITNDAMKLLKAHSDTLVLSVNWKLQNMQYTPYDRWSQIWREL